jgi:putative membrane protein
MGQERSLRRRSWGGLDRSRLLAAVVLYGIVAILLHRLLTGTLVYYINPRYEWLTWVAVAGFGAMALALAGTAWRRARDSRRPHGMQVGWSALAVLALPVALGMAPEQPLGSAALGNREVAVASLPPTALTSKTGRRVTRVAAAEPAARSMLDWLVEFHVADDPKRFAGQGAQITGFVHRDVHLGPDQVQLSRFLLSCCVADATPIGIVAQASELATVPDDQWLTVTGRFAVGEIGGERMPVLVADEVVPIEPPPVPYLYY